jgi:uncharacterized zinc-type alcohol dehydrogenase-like protein
VVAWSPYRPGCHGTFDLLLNTVSERIDVAAFLGLLRLDGVLVAVGALARGVRVFTRSMIAGIPETREMLDFCAANSIDVATL